MSQTTDGNTEALKWPIAPDGYIPNSVIRSWRRKKQDSTGVDCCNDGIYSLNWDDCLDDLDDISTRVILITEDEEEEVEKTITVKRRKKEMEDEKNQVDKVEKEKGRVDERKDQMDRLVLVKQSYDIHPESPQQNQLKTSDDGKPNVEPLEDFSTYNSRKTVNFPFSPRPTSCPENEPKPSTEMGEDVKLPETITLPVQHLSVSSKQQTSSFIPEESLAPCWEGPVASATTLIYSVNEPRITSLIPPTEPENLTLHSPKPPPPTPEDPQLQPDLGPLESLPTTDKNVHLSSTIRDQTHVPLDPRVLELYRKIKADKKNSHLRQLSNTAERPPTSTCSTVYAHDMLCPRHQLGSNCPAHFEQMIPSIKDKSSNMSMPEWRKNMRKVISIQGFCSPRAARLAAQEHPVKFSSVNQIIVTIPPLQPGQAAAHQRVVQNVQMKDSPEPAPFHFHYVIPMPSQHSYITVNPCGKTQYGRLQFDWMRGSEGHDQLKVSRVLIKDDACKVLDQSTALNHRNKFP